MPHFRKLPVEIEAVQYDGSTTSYLAIKSWMHGKPYIQP